LQLLNSTKVNLHRLLMKNYGLLYQQNAQIFFDMFRNFREFYLNGNVNLQDALDEFFASLFQRIFTLLNAQHSFDDTYQECIAESTERIQPFGNVPKQLASQIQKTFAATRTFSRALATGRDVLNDYLSKVLTSQSSYLTVLFCHSVQIIEH
jgi:glypican 4